MKFADSHRIIFFGTSDFAVPCLKKLQATRLNSGFKPRRATYKLQAVITQPDKPVGRKQVLSASPVKLAAQELKIPVLQFESLKSEKAQEQILNLKPDIAIVVSYGKIIPQSLLDKIPKGFVNVHPSLLPKYRGATPIQSAILNGETETGTSIMLIDSEMDHGPLLAQKLVTIDDNDNYITLSNRLAKMSAELLVKTLTDYLEGKITPKAQDHTKATLTKPLTRNDGRVDWTKEAKQIYNQWHAYIPWPGTWTVYNGERIKLLELRRIETNRSLTPGEFGLFEDKLIVATAQGGLEIVKLQREGQKEVSGIAFWNGLQSKKYQKFAFN